MQTAQLSHSEVDAAISGVLAPAISGDAHALQELINLIHPQVVRFCRARVTSDKYPTADDIAQEVSLAVAQSIRNYVDKGLPFMAFVYRIASNKIVDARRSQARDFSHPLDELPDSVSPNDNPESEMMMLDACQQVSGLLDLLNDNARDILVLHIFGGYSAEETANILGTTPGAVRVAQFRALAKLRKHLKGA